jgi:hypothetical protein
MQPALHAIGWGLPRLAIAIAATAFAVILAYSALVFVIIVVQAASAFGQ